MGTNTEDEGVLYNSRDSKTCCRLRSDLRNSVLSYLIFQLYQRRESLRVLNLIKREFESTCNLNWPFGIFKVMGPE